MPFPICLLMILSSLMQSLYDLRIESTRLYLCHNFLLKGNNLICFIEIHSSVHPFVHNFLQNRYGLFYLYLYILSVLLLGLW